MAEKKKSLYPNTFKKFQFGQNRKLIPPKLPFDDNYWWPEKEKKPAEKPISLKGQSIARFPVEAVYNNFRCQRGTHFADPYDVLICEEGHFSCGDCVLAMRNKDKLEECCAGKLHLYTGRWLQLVMESARFRCENEDKGCKEVMTGYSAIQEHMKKCKFSE